MEQLSVPRSYDLNLGDVESSNDCYTAPYNANFVLEYQYPNVPSFTEDLAAATYSSPQTPTQFGIGFGYSHVKADECLSIPPATDDGHLLDTEVGLNNTYMFDNSYQSIEASLACPVSVDSSIEKSPWGSAEPVQHAAIWDLSTLHTDSCSISAGERFDWSGAFPPVTPSEANTAVEEELKNSALLLKISLADSFRYPCSHKTCTKSFKRKEHAKRHYLTCCEFCGKDTFTRTDNLNAHRRLHARSPPKPSSGVHFVPAALEAFKRRTKPAQYNQRLLHLAS
ncbi:zinc finger odd-paired-like (opl) [Fusarium sp. NRRL 52700]|nr:zinc finger odd-paired-like (opl) [Fusarium sp. NRRL 52700]